MGSGIVVLLAEQLVHLKIKNPEKIFRLNLIDINEAGLDGLRQYLKDQLRKIAENKISVLRNLYHNHAELIENHEIIDAFIDETLALTRFNTDINTARDSFIVFEAVIENEALKVSILKKLKQICQPDTIFLTNTSSIPIQFLNQKAGLNKRIVGYHFYNPPIIQKLVELIFTEGTDQYVREIGIELGVRLNKTLVYSKDIAGFIGNGHFIRDGLYGLMVVKKLTKQHSFPQAVYLINRLTQDLLIRPMGIFQLIDYVGIDVFGCILSVMKKHLKQKSLSNPVIEALLAKKIAGGQKSDGSQKDGFFQYQANKITAIYDIETAAYVPYEAIHQQLNDQFVLKSTECKPWKNLVKHSGKQDWLQNYFLKLKTETGWVAKEAIQYMQQSKKIGVQLIADQVAQNEKDVNDVLMNGFFWLYGPVNNYLD
jgi:3-hydroxyacyl-CoA dehydrogenase